MFIIGINAYHGDSSACIINDGNLIAAVEEERFRRVKHWAGFPSKSIEYCLNEAGVGLKQIDAIAINQDSKANIGKKISFTLKKRPDFKFVLDRIRNRKDRVGLDKQLERAFHSQSFTGKIHAVEHHQAHLSSAFHVSPFEEAIVVSVDGFGDFASGAWGVGRGNSITVEDRVFFPHSLGTFYQALTQFLGFPHYGDEFKIMGLAPYGKPQFMKEMRQLVSLKNNGGYELDLSYFTHHKENPMYEWDDGAPKFGRIFSAKLKDLLGPARQKGDELTQKHKDIAHSVQAMYEEAFFHLINTLHDRHKINNLALSGGCAMNSVANGKVYRRSSYKNVYIQSAAGDAGGAIGAAYSVYFAENNNNKKRFVMDHAFWGPEYSDQEIEIILKNNQLKLDEKQCTFTQITDEKELCKITAKTVSEGKVIGWFQGRMEWGPRSLGNRSIVCDPRRADMKDILNLKIKRRESFRPFAPSILREDVKDWFEEDDDVPFMMKVFQIKEDKRSDIPAVTHADGSGRLQTVFKNTNHKYYSLIEEFKNITGVPIVLNTSFNENEPVVCHPQEALDCFLRTRMDVLVLGNWFIERNEQGGL